MTVQELIDKLSKIPGHREVYMSADQEGNRYNKIKRIDDNGILVDAKYGDIFSEHFTAREAYMSEEEWEDVKTNYPRIVVIWP